MDVICSYCGRQAKLVTGAEIYPHRRDLHKKLIWSCKPCGAYVGTHEGTEKPLGRLANEELRNWKMKAHKAFDPKWRSGEMKRQEAYKWLSNQLDIDREKCHIGMFDIDMCKRVIEVCES